MKLNTIGAAERLNLKQKTLENWRCLGVGPPFYKIGERASTMKQILTHGFNRGAAHPRLNLRPEQNSARRGLAGLTGAEIKK